MKIRLNKSKLKMYLKFVLSAAVIAAVGFACVKLHSYLQYLKANELQISRNIVYTQEIEEDAAEYIISYMDTYFLATANLKYTDITSFYDTSNLIGYESAYLNQAALYYTILQRTNSPVDLRCKTLNYKINFIECEETDGVLNITFEESYQAGFRGLEGGTSFVTAIKHEISLAKVTDGYKIVSHSWEGTYQIVEDIYDTLIPSEGIGSISICEKTIASLNDEIKSSLDDMAYYYSLKRKDYAENKDSYLYSAECTHAYDRQAAADYANLWVSSDEIKRNPDFGIYDELGGNCNNYISQCISAGGIPMDSNGLYQWKYYSDEVNESNEAAGRSTSWISIDDFYTYCAYNENYGLLAFTNCQLYSAQVGDIIQMNIISGWDHCVIVTKIIYDENGNPIDFLVNSNNSDRGSYPLSAYEAKQLRLIKIIGWNE